MTAETFMVRTVGGPHPGTRVANTEGGATMDWPLPSELPDEGGKYVKGTESQLPPQEPGSLLMRGAEYFWQPDVGEPVMCGACGKNPATHTWSGHPTCDDCAAPSRAGV